MREREGDCRVIEHEEEDACSDEGSFGSEEMLQKQVNKISLREFSKHEKNELETCFDGMALECLPK